MVGWTRSDGRLFNLGRLRAETKVREALTRDTLFADDAAVTTHTQQELQALVDHFSQACKDFGLSVCRRLGSTITDNLSLEIDKSIGKAATTIARLTSRVWTNRN